MSLLLTAIFVAVLCLLIGIWIRRAKAKNEMEEHSITPEALHSLLASNQEVLVFDVRQPLDLLADSEMIVGATRIPPRDLLENPSLIPNEKTSRLVSERALAMHLMRIKFLKGGLAGWKAMGYPVERYETPFHLDTRT